MVDTGAIGLIDSGIGGFTVLREVQRILPDEDIIYLGDSYRMPYGELDDETIVHYANSDIRFLEDRGVKAILLACNTVSSKIGSLTSKVPLFSIVEAGCKAVIQKVMGKEFFLPQKYPPIGLIATRATVRSNIYPETLATMTDQIQFVQHGTATLASVINNYPKEIQLLRKHIREAIDPLVEEKAIHTLLLGCTHYPIVRESIEAMYPDLALINPASQQVEALKDTLESENKRIAHADEGHGKTTVYTTGTLADMKIFGTMLDYLDIHCDRLERCRLDID